MSTAHDFGYSFEFDTGKGGRGSKSSPAAMTFDEADNFCERTEQYFYCSGTETRASEQMLCQEGRSDDCMEGDSCVRFDDHEAEKTKDPQSQFTGGKLAWVSDIETASN